MDKESALFYVVLLLFAATGIVTLLGLVQKVTIEKKYLNALFSARPVRLTMEVTSSICISRASITWAIASLVSSEVPGKTIAFT